MADSSVGAFVLAAVAAGIAWVIGNSKSDERIANDRRELNRDREVKELALKTERSALTDMKRITDAKLEKITQTRAEISSSYVAGRKWLAAMITEAEANSDKGLQNYLRYKKRPAPTASDNVKEIAAEKRAWMLQAKVYEYQIKQLEEYFPILAEYGEAILEEMVPNSANLKLDSIDSVDPVLAYLTKAEWDKLNPAAREQLALSRYLERPAKNSWDAGLRYERYLGYLYEKSGWSVDYVGAIKGLEDFGRDLICRKGDECCVVQAKRWNKDRSVIHMKHVVQLFGTCVLLKSEQSLRTVPKPILISTAEFAIDAKSVADTLGVVLNVKPLDKSYPTIKVHASRVGEPLYHLPYDQQYDRIKMKLNDGDRYVNTVIEAHKFGARRAMKFTFQK